MSKEPFELENIDHVNYVTNLMAQSGDLYDVVRIVDPTLKKVTEHRGSRESGYSEKCYGFWSGNEDCKDCLAARAYREHRMMLRMEYSKGLIYMKTVVPVTMEGREVVVELIKNITENITPSHGENLEATDGVQAVEELDEKAFKDEETGAYNRRYIDEQLPVELARVRTSRYPLTLVLVGFDGFQKMAIDYGSTMCGAIIRSMGEMLVNSMRSEQDWVARYAPDQFLVVMRNTARAPAKTVAERIRMRIERAEFLYGGMPVPLTASLAVFTEEPGSPTKESILPMLEKKIYASGLAGGNRVI